MTKPLRYLLWCAVSTKAQAEDHRVSLPTQQTDQEAFVQSQGGQIVDALIVPGHSRRYIDIHECARDMLAEGIEAFSKLLHYWESHAFDVLVVRDGDRFARTQSLHAYVVERTISIGARIYSLSDGWIDETNYRMWAAMSGYKAAAEIDTLTKRREIGMMNRVMRGIHPNKIDFAHLATRDQNGKATGLVINPDARRLLDDMAALVIAGVSFEDLEDELHKRGHRHPKTGRPFPKRGMYHFFYNPFTWGHSAYRKRVDKYGPWAFDPSIPPPNGVIVKYNTHEACFTGATGELIKAELLRRRELIKGRRRPHTHRFSGLLLCERCHRPLVLNSLRPNYRIYMQIQVENIWQNLP